MPPNATSIDHTNTENLLKKLLFYISINRWYGAVRKLLGLGRIFNVLDHVIYENKASKNVFYLYLSWFNSKCSDFQAHVFLQKCRFSLVGYVSLLGCTGPIEHIYEQKLEPLIKEE